MAGGNGNSWSSDVAEHLPDYVSIIDGDLRFLATNYEPRYEGHLTREQLVSMTAEVFFPPDRRQVLLGAVERLFESGEPIQYASSSPDGLSHWSTRIVRLPDVDGQRRALMVATETTAEVKARRALEESERRLALALDAARIGLFDWHRVSDAMTLGEPVRTIVVRARGEAPERRADFLKAIHPDDRDALDHELKRHLEGETEAYQAEYRIATGEGEVVGWVHERGQAVERAPDGLATRILGTHLDVTGPRQQLERQQALESELMRSQRLETVGRLAGGIAHDFNNLLMVIKTQTEFAREAQRAGQNAMQELDDISMAADRASTLTRQLLSFGQVDDHEPMALELGDWLRRVSPTLRTALRAGVDLHLEVRADGVVKAAPRRLELVLLNLCLEASEKLDSDGELTVVVDRVVLPASDPRLVEADMAGGTFMTVELRGRHRPGPGEAAGWTPLTFRRARGVGQAIVQDVVEQHGGFVHLGNADGEPTAITVYLRATDRPSEDEVPPLTLLLAEDDPMVRTVMVRILHHGGYRVFEASDGQEAIAVFEAHVDEIDLVILDAVMPRMHGREAFEAIRRQRPEVPVVFCSGYAAASLSAEYLAEHEMELLRKPVDRAGLLRAVDSALARRSS